MDNERKKIAVVGITYPFRGGISHYTTILVRNLRRFYDTYFVSFKRQYPALLFPGVTQYDKSENAIKEENVRLIDSLCPLSWMRAAYKIAKYGASAVIFQWYNPFFAFVVYTISRILKKRGIKPVIICHNVIPHETGMLDRLLTRIAFANCEDFLVHSSADMENLRAIKSGANVVKGYHPTYDVFDYRELDRDTVKNELGIAEEKVLLFFGYVRRYKGLDILLKAFAKARQNEDMRLLVVGEFYDDKAVYTGLIEELGIADKVTVVDRYVANEEVARYFSSCDAVILPYTSASQSGIVQIAYALGVPVIATDTGGLPDVVDDGVTGYIVKKGDADSLSDGIKKFYSKRADVDFKGNIKRELEKYSWDALINSLERLF